MSATTIKIAYCGEAVDTGKMDINLLAPALLSLSNLIQESNRILCDGETKTNVYVQADFELGSFEINIEVVQTVVAQLQNLFGNRISLADVLSALGIYSWSDAGVVAGGLIGFYKWLKGRTIEKVKKHDESHFAVKLLDGEETIVSVPVIKLYQSVVIQEKLDKTLAPLETSGIDRFEVRNPETKTVTTSISSKERRYFYPIEPEYMPEQTETSRVMRAYVLSAQFEDGLKWRLSDGSNKFWATIKDEDFVKAVDSGEIGFVKGVSLQIELLEKQTQDAKGKIKTEHFVTKVIEYIPRPENLVLPFDEGE